MPVILHPEAIDARQDFYRVGVEAHRNLLADDRPDSVARAVLILLFVLGQAEVKLLLGSQSFAIMDHDTVCRESVSLGDSEIINVL